MDKNLRNLLLHGSLAGLNNQDLTVLYNDSEYFLEPGNLNFSLFQSDAKTIHRIDQALKKDVSPQLEILNREQIVPLIIEDDDYPISLSQIENFPIVLYTRGNRELLKENYIGMVGARKHTDYGKRICEKFSREIIDSGLGIISGLALGIDGLSHKIALSRGGSTIAVLGNGIDSCYPQKNVHIWREIIDQGLIISEYSPGSPPLPFHFPERNRIISGLSKAVVVIEAQEKSGSLITARLAAEQGREVFAVPGNIDSLYSTGTNLLIRDGAIPLLTIEDLFFALPIDPKNKSKHTVDLSLLSEEEKEIYNLIKEGTQHFDLIRLESNFETSEILSILTLLEMKELITGVDSDQLSIN